MADQATKDATAKQRIINHMNADHHDSVIRYLERYHDQSSWRAYSGEIVDITLSDMTIRSDAGTFKTSFEPPMSSFREARERLVAMDKECVQALGRSDITVREWVAPRGRFLALFIIVSTTFVAFSRRSHFGPDGVAARYLPDGFRSFCYTIQPYVLTFMLALHCAEAVHMARGRLRRHSVNMRAPVYWQWVVDAFVSGFGCFWRFDRLVDQKEAAKAQQKH